MSARAWLRVAIAALLLSVAIPWTLTTFEPMQYVESGLAAAALLGYAVGLSRDSHPLRLWSLRLGAFVWLAVGYRTVIEGVYALANDLVYLNPAALVGVSLWLCGAGLVFVHAAKDEADGQ